MPIQLPGIDPRDVEICLREDHAPPGDAPAPTSAPIIQTSLFTFPTFRALIEGLDAEHRTHVYSRGQNPTVEAFERKLADLEGGEGCKAALTSHGGVTSLVIGDLYQGAFRERGLAPENLSRSLEDSVTITEPLMPWTVSAVYMATTLGVPTVAYAPWAVFCYCGSLFSLLIAAGHPRTAFALPPANGGGTPEPTTTASPARAAPL